ncbi:MAG TPA: hypothetical protein DDZ35_14755 [Halomonas sp.]|nr:hypothetical protein [Halomonas sp.]
MGKARILQAHGEGRYTIEIIEARERAESAKQQAEARIQTLIAEVNQLDAKIQAAQQAVDLAVTEQNAAIEQWQQEVAEEGSSTINLAEAAEKVMAAAGERDALRAEKRSKELRITADQALVARINALPPLRQMQAWCADYTDDLSGEVATVEVPGEIGDVIIKPGFEDANQWSATADGAMQPALASTPAATFYNLAMLPGWQKWRPTYRTATITSIDGDTCSITLDAATSSQRGLSVNARSSYSGVPILYMDCNGAAFEQGDKVLVAFAGNINGPTVVGFESAPKACGIVAAFSFNKRVFTLHTPIGGLRICNPVPLTSDHTPFRLRGETLIQKDTVRFYKLPSKPDEITSMDDLDEAGATTTTAKIMAYSQTYENEPNHYSDWGVWTRDGRNRCTIYEDWRGYNAPVLNSYLLDNETLTWMDFLNYYRENYYDGVDIDPTVFSSTYSETEMEVEIGHLISNQRLYASVTYSGLNASVVSKSDTSYVKTQTKNINIEDLPALIFNGRTLKPKRFLGHTQSNGEIEPAFPGALSASNRRIFDVINNLSVLVVYS